MNLNEWVGGVRGRGLALAKALGVQPPAVSDWATGKKQVPLEQCIPIERFTDKEVTCEEMRPDKAADFAYLRGLDGAAQEIRAQAATETVAINTDALPPISDLPPIVATPTAPAWDGIDRRAPVSKVLPPELERRAALAGGV